MRRGENDDGPRYGGRRCAGQSPAAYSESTKVGRRLVARATSCRRPRNRLAAATVASAISPTPTVRIGTSLRDGGHGHDSPHIAVQYMDHRKGVSGHMVRGVTLQYLSGPIRAT